ncbi:phage terminase small subunit P27 family [Paenibacillus sp. TAB 01]|uniref:phage terminase small subunit P27 family n=1 Tax=Paenibacillus sp. TAB 01 TaxID=3368988 RepID=UPI003751EF07
MGRQKKPIDVLIQDGKKHLTKAEIAKRRREEAKVKGENDKLACPDWVQGRVARNIYQATARELKKIELLANLDVTTLGQYANAMAKYREVNQAIQGAPLLVPKPTAYGDVLVENPLFRLHVRYAEETRKYGDKLGLTLGARLKLSTTPKGKEPPKPKSKYAEFTDEDDNG